MNLRRALILLAAIVQGFIVWHGMSACDRGGSMRYGSDFYWGWMGLRADAGLGMLVGMFLPAFLFRWMIEAARAEDVEMVKRRGW